MKLDFCRQIVEKNAQKSSFMKVRPVGAELLQYRRTDGHEEADGLAILRMRL
jgi:hypothetical protein